MTDATSAATATVDTRDDHDEREDRDDQDPAAEVAEPDGGQEPDGEDRDPEGADQLGDPGKRALAAMKDKWRAERDKRRQLEQQLAAKSGDGDDRQRQDRQEALAKANQRILRAEIRAAAKGKLADPKDAFKFLDLDAFEVGEDGEVDADEIEEAIDELLQNKPYLAAQSGPPKRFHGTADSGARKGNGRPTQLTEADVKRLAAEGKHTEIVKAREEGRLDDYLGLNR